MEESYIGKWVEVELVNGKKWIGKLEEWDEEAVFISNGTGFGEDGHKGAECASNEVANVDITDKRSFEVK